ncbi:MAG: tetratricopeptide repeat protein [Bacteroidia bacterium]|nr:tetratricopeptide repeat protein [Bacteroidia bacterium]
MAEIEEVCRKVELLLDLRKADLAIGLLTDHPDLHQNARALYLLSRCYYLTGQPQARLAAVQQCLALKPEMVSGLIELAKCYELTDRDHALDILGRCLALSPEEPAIRGMMGVMHLRNGDFEKAAEAFEKVLELDPEDGGTVCNLAVCMAKLGRHAEEEALLLHGLELEPENTYLFINLGVLYSDTGRYDQAEEFYLRALALDPNDASPIYGLACVYCLREQDEKALDYLQRSIQLDSSYKTYVLGDPDFNRLKKHPLFLNIIS